MSEQAKYIHRWWPDQREWQWCWDTTPWGGGHIADRGYVGAVGLPDGGLLFLDSGKVIHPDKQLDVLV